MPTIEQIRAARALLDWSQSDLADYAGLSQTGIARIENGTNKPNTKTLDKINTAFDAKGIEFIDGGVRTNSDKLIVLRGEDSLKKLQDDIYHTVSVKKDDIRFLGIEEISPDESENYKYSQMHIQRLIEIDVKERILVKESETNFLAPKHWYKKISEEHFSPHTVAIYGEKIALVLREPHYKVLILNNPFFAETMKIFFDSIWSNAKIVE